MNKFYLFTIIIVFLFKTGNVFSSVNDFHVNNIIVSGNNNNNSQEKLLNLAFQKGFDKFINKLLLEKDISELSDTKLSVIKNLIFSYQIVPNEKKFKNRSQDGKFIVNLAFDRKKIYKFFISRNISYADLSETSLTIFPVLLENERLFLYSNNPFYKNWNLKEEDSFIKYSLPLENIEDLEYLNNNKNNLELIDVNKLESIYEDKNYVFVIINDSNNSITAFLKSSIYGKKIIKNIELNQVLNDKQQTYELATQKIKKEITQIWKSQNLVDVGSPSFLNIFLEMNKVNDFHKLKTSLDKIDLIEKYSVVELNKNYARIKIKYIGKIDKIINKFKDQNIQIEKNNDEWKLELK